MREEWRDNPLGSGVGLLGSSRLCWLWDRCMVKGLHQELGFCFASERGGEYTCKLPGIGFRTDLIKDCTDSLSARNSKY